MIRVAINGFGRIGRCLTRLLADTNKDLELVAINSRADIARDIHLFKYDSVHGRFPGTVAAHGENLIINGREVRVTRVLDPEGLPWKELGVDIVLESTGAFRDRASNEGHLKAGAQRVILGAPGKKLDATFVYGVNHTDFDPARHRIISNASCTTNCLAPVVKVLHNVFGLEYGLMTTCHSYTMDQRLLDGSHSDYQTRPGRLPVHDSHLYRRRPGGHRGDAGIDRPAGRSLRPGPHAQRVPGGPGGHSNPAHFPGRG